MKDIRQNINRLEKIRENMSVEDMESVCIMFDRADIDQIIWSLKTNNAIESVLDEELKRKLKRNK